MFPVPAWQEKYLVAPSFLVWAPAIDNRPAQVPDDITAAVASFRQEFQEDPSRCSSKVVARFPMIFGKRWIL